MHKGVVKEAGAHQDLLAIPVKKDSGDNVETGWYRDLWETQMGKAAEGGDDGDGKEGGVKEAGQEGKGTITEMGEKDMGGEPEDTTCDTADPTISQIGNAAALPASAHPADLASTVATVTSLEARVATLLAENMQLRMLAATQRSFHSEYHMNHIEKKSLEIDSGGSFSFSETWPPSARCCVGA